MTTKEDVKKLLNKYEEIEILENALLCERQLNIELQEQIEKMKNCENCKHWDNDYKDCQFELKQKFDCKHFFYLNRFSYYIDNLAKGNCRPCLSKHTKIHCDFLNCPNRIDYWELKND